VYRAVRAQEKAMRNITIALAVAGTLFVAVPASAGVVPAKPTQLGVQTDITQARYYYHHYSYRHRYYHHRYYHHHYYRHHYRRYY
jgi:hypothetical protein